MDMSDTLVGNQYVVHDEQTRGSQSSSGSEILRGEGTSRATICLQASEMHDLLIVTEPNMQLGGKGVSAQHFFIRERMPSCRSNGPMKIVLPQSLKAIPLENQAPGTCLVVPDDTVKIFVNRKIEREDGAIFHAVPKEECEDQISEVPCQVDNSNVNGSRSESANIGPLVWSDRESTTSITVPHILSRRHLDTEYHKFITTRDNHRFDVSPTSVLRAPQRSQHHEERTGSLALFKKPAMRTSSDVALREARSHCRHLLERLKGASSFQEPKNLRNRKMGDHSRYDSTSSRSGSPFSFASDRFSAASPVFDNIRSYRKGERDLSEIGDLTVRLNSKASRWRQSLNGLDSMDKFYLDLSRRTKLLPLTLKADVKLLVSETVTEVELANNLKRPYSWSSSVAPR